MPNTLDPNSAVPTILQDSVNIVLSTLGEAPVNSLTGTTASLALNIIEEVSNDIQSKGWWFNQQTGGNFSSSANIIIYPSNTSSDWHANIPEEARRYITIRAARIAHTRLIGTEENFKFSFQEEQVSLAILQQAHVRNSNGDLSFSSYPSDLKNLGIDEYIFIQGNLEEKLRTIGLASELSNRDKTVAETTLLGNQASNVTADTTLKGKQGSLVDAQAADVAADTTLKGKQGSLVDAQAADVAADTTLKGKQGSLVDAQAADVAADTTLKGKQGSLVDAQAADVTADTTLKGKQGSLVDAQATDVAADTTLKGKQGSLVDAQSTDVGADTTLKGKQGSLVDAQRITEGAQQLVLSTQAALNQDIEAKTEAEKNLIEQQKLQLVAATAMANLEGTVEKQYYDRLTGEGGSTVTYRTHGAALRMIGIQEKEFNALPVYKKREFLVNAKKYNTATATEQGTSTYEIDSVRRIMSLIGEPPVSSLNANAMASEAVRHLRRTQLEIQGRGWWFNVEKDVELTPVENKIFINKVSILSVEAENYNTRFKQVSGQDFLYDIKKQSHESWDAPIKAIVIYKLPLSDLPQKFLEYLEVRVAMILTELYPQSGIDIQRLPKMEAELETYFKDREAEEGNYSVFDNYDASVRVGVNRSYNLF